MYDVNNLPSGSEYDPPERIVGACNRYGDVLLVGVRHGGDDMYSMWEFAQDKSTLMFNEILYDEEQGFITSKYRFVNRQEAWKIAVGQRQVVRRVGGDDANGGTLYSENLY